MGRIARTHCKWGHEFTYENTLIRKENGWRKCRACHNNETKARNKANPKMLLNFNLKRLYGITVEQYEELVRLQGGKCAICNMPPDKNNCKDDRLVVDHCHIKGKGTYRGLLCALCNAGLGFLKDSIYRLESAIKYLKERD